MAAQAVRWSGIPKVARSRFSQCSKSCDLQCILCIVYSAYFPKFERLLESYLLNYSNLIMEE